MVEGMNLVPEHFLSGELLARARGLRVARAIVSRSIWRADSPG